MLVTTPRYPPQKLLLSRFLTPDRILFFFRNESDRTITELLAGSLIGLDANRVLNAIRVAEPSGPTVLGTSLQVYRGQRAGLDETRATMAISRFGCEYPVNRYLPVHLLILFLAPAGDRFQERAFLRSLNRLFLTEDLTTQLSRRTSPAEALSMIRNAES